jgi:hypothetical protein
MTCWLSCESRVGEVNTTSLILISPQSFGIKALSSSVETFYWSIWNGSLDGLSGLVRRSAHPSNE